MPNHENPTMTGGYDSGARIFLTGATGTIGAAVCAELEARGHHTVCFGRTSGPSTPPAAANTTRTEWRAGDVTDPHAITTHGLKGERFDAVISCLASRTGTPTDAWAIDHGANAAVLAAATAAQVPHFILLSAICVQKPQLAFQHAKLAFEAELQAAALTWTIVRPTAFFKSLTGQLDRVRAGKPYLLFGDGRLTACKPISDRDLARYIVGALDDPTRHNRILPIGGPGPAITPRDTGEHLFQRLGRSPKFQSMPIAAMRAIAGGLDLAARIVPPLREKAAYARIGLYYATESMLVWDEASQCYDAAATPETGSDTLHAHINARFEG